MKIILLCLLISITMLGCTQHPIIQTQTIVLKPPYIVPCQRMSLQQCKPRTNGELYECALKISYTLDQCAAQTDALIQWQQNN